MLRWKKERGSDKCLGLSAWRRCSLCLGLVKVPWVSFSICKVVKAFIVSASYQLKQAGGRFVVCKSALVLQTSNPSTGISHNILAVSLCGHEESGVVLGISIPRDSCVSPALLGCRKQNLQETEWSLRELGLIVRILWGG